MSRVGTRQDHLLGGGSQLIELSLLAARASSASKRVSAGLELDDQDRRVLDALSDVLEAAARSVEFFDSGGRTGSPAVGALASQVDAAIDAVLDEAPRPEEATELSQRLNSLALLVRRLPAAESEATVVAEILSVLTASVLRQTGHVGEVTSYF
jgi:hypothetical protein